MNQKHVVAVVDDDDGVRESLEGLIRSLGYGAAAFRSAEEYLSRDRDLQCSCVISDIRIPGGMSGLKLAREIAASPQKTPVILISAFVNAEITADANAAGVVSVFKKPFDGDDLIESLERAITA